MLQHLYIRNFTLIDELDLDFHSGFSVITGETGAGKSIILGAIGLLLGQRADSKSVKSGHEKCTIEAHFDLSKYDLESFFDENDIDYDEEDCILRRELTVAGKSRAFINDTPVQLTIMRELGNQLIDIHSQHQNLLLNKENFQLNVIDIIGNCEQQIDDYKLLFGNYLSAKKELDNLKESIERNKQNEDFLRFQLNELEQAALKDGEQEEIEQETQLMEHAEDIKTSLFETDNILSGDNSCIETIRQCYRRIQSISNVFPMAEEISSRLESCQIELKDISQEVASALEQVDFDPNRLEYCQNRLDLIYKLQQKHHVETIKELLDIKQELRLQVDNIDNSDNALSEKESAIKSLFDECSKKALSISKIRAKAAKKIEKEIIERLIALGMPNVRFNIKIVNKPLSQDGCDKVAFLFSANTGMQLQPISEVASGGEIARVMLSLKAMISGAVKLPTIIFDEIDTGVSGKIAEQMANIMTEMGKNDRQVISITHLPQIASQGKTHYKVYKNDTQEGTTTYMHELNKEERIKEIAQMLSGSTITDAAIDNAKQLLGN